MDAINANKSEIEDSIIKTFNQLTKTIQDRKRYLLEKLEEETLANMTLLVLQETQKIQNRDRPKICKIIFDSSATKMAKVISLINQVGDILYPSPQQSTFTVCVKGKSYVIDLTVKTLDNVVYLHGGLDVSANIMCPAEHISCPAEHVSCPAGHISRPAEHVSCPAGHISRPAEHVSCPAGHISRPAEHVSCPAGHISRPAEHVSCPAGHVSCPAGHISCPAEHVSCPAEHVSCPAEHIPQDNSCIDIIDNYNGTYKIIITPLDSSVSNIISIKINGQNVQNSPCKCMAIEDGRHAESFSRSVEDDLVFSKTSDVALSSETYVVSRTYSDKGHLHSFDDQPAVTFNNGSVMYYFDDKFHRDGDKPAIIYFHSNGKIHQYYKNGKHHRENGPAIIRYNLQNKIISIEYYLDDKRHKIDGPSVITIKDDIYNVDGVDDVINVINVNKINEVNVVDDIYDITKFSEHKKIQNGILYIWYLNDKIDRSDDGPTIIFANGVHIWYKNDTLHRDNGPAIIQYQNDKIILEEYYKDGLRHRIDGPAVIRGNTKIYYRNDQIHRSDGFACEFESGVRMRYLNGALNSDDGPAITYPDGSQFYYSRNILIRKKGPAVDLASGTRKYYGLGDKRFPQNDNTWLHSIESADGSQYRHFGEWENKKITELCPDGSIKYYGFTNGYNPNHIYLNDVRTIDGLEVSYRSRENGDVTLYGRPAVRFPDGRQLWYTFESKGCGQSKHYEEKLIVSGTYGTYV